MTATSRIAILAVWFLVPACFAGDPPHVVVESRDQRVVVEILTNTASAPRPTGPVLVTPRDGSLFGLEVVGVHPRLVERRVVASVPHGGIATLRFHNRAPFDVAAEIYLDGIAEPQLVGVFRASNATLLTLSAVTGGRSRRVTVLVRAAWPTDADGPRVEPVRPGERLDLNVPGNETPAEYVVGPTILASITLDFEVLDPSPASPDSESPWDRVRRWRR